ncbi:hypothetical protein VKT23_018468 [Stygiomarasmius scandens]|uniref:C2H2-type domain-containing protein n=1 Tax=Marasmiellus scandens TaxID=2682957 RepID=A0ABR1INY6_9AGAR
MSTVCPGCQKSFSAGAGFTQHLRKTQNEACRTYAAKLELEKPDFDPRTMDNLLRGFGAQRSTEFMLIDGIGDYFGDYSALDDNDIAVDGGTMYMTDPNVPPSFNDESANDTSDDNNSDDGYETGGDTTGRLNQKLTTQNTGYEPAPPPQSNPAREPEHDSYAQHFGHSPNIWAPFTSEIDWRVAKWAKLRGPSSTALTELLAIDGVPQKLGLSYGSAGELNKIIDNDLPGRPQFHRHEVIVQGEAFDVYFRDIMQCVKALYRDAEFAPYLKFAPERHFEDESCTEQLYHDMHTGSWWWSTQETLESNAGPGRTIAPLIISSDKTQVTLFRNKSAYPVYMTLGNIPKEIRRKPSKRAYVLLGYLPASRLEHVKSVTSRRRCVANLFHTCMRHITKPLREPGAFGIIMTSGNGVDRLVHPIFAVYIADYPEQILVTCGISGFCPHCTIPRQRIGENTEPHPLRNLSSILEALQKIDAGASVFVHACKDAGMKPVFEPFWADLPYSNVFVSITPDLLHQLYQGVLKHMKLWIIQVYGAHEIDARCRRLPPNHNIRIFMKGIATLSHVTGQEHDQISHFLLGLIADTELP